MLVRLAAFLVIWSVPAVAAAAEDRPRLENASLIVELAVDGRLNVLDKRTGTAWRQVELPLPRGLPHLPRVAVGPDEHAENDADRLRQR